MQLLFNNILGKALTRKASDIHFIPSDKEVILKFRIN
ncbi:type II/IV secretion system protein, partial [Staphylococcus gallinarum]